MRRYCHTRVESVATICILQYNKRPHNEVLTETYSSPTMERYRIEKRILEEGNGSVSYSRIIAVAS